MSRRSTPLIRGGNDGRDGTSQADRRAPALDPASVAIDGRGLADLLAFVQAHAEELRFFVADGDQLREAGTWGPFARRDDLTIADVVAYVEDPGRFAGERARWLGRPHFALLLAFLELLGHARDQLNGITRRHLDHHYREILGMRPGPPVPDRVRVVLRLAAGVAEARLPAGVALQAGRDSAGVPRIYRSEREVTITRARVDAIRVVHVERRVVGLAALRRDRGLSPDEAFDAALRLALGDPGPGDPVPTWEGQAIDRAFVGALPALLGFARERLALEHHELRRLMQLVRRREAADAEWAAVHQLLGVDAPSSPRDFAGCLARAVGDLDFRADGLPQVHRVDDLYEQRAEPEVRAYIDDRLAAIGFDRFVAAMAIKRRIDGEWAEIRRILEGAGRRRRGALAWELDGDGPRDLAADLARAHGDAWPPPWPWGTSSVAAYEALIRRLEAHFALPAERLARLAALAGAIASRSEAAWRELEALLVEAHRERARARRRATLTAARGGDDGLAGLDAVVGAALGRAGAAPPWEEARALLATRLDAGALALLDRFRGQLVDPAAARVVTWSDVERALEALLRPRDRADEPSPRRSEWRNLHAFADPSALVDDPASPRWRTFGRPAAADESRPPPTTLGWALTSPSLALGEGARALTLTLGLRPVAADTVVRGLGLAPGAFDAAALRAAIGGVLRLEVSTDQGFVEVPLIAAAIAGGGVGDDYWSLLGEARRLSEDRPALQLRALADPTFPAITPAPGSGDRSPTLRVLLRQRWDAQARAWTTALPPFEALVLVAVHLRVDVDGLAALQLQQGARAVDPRRPFEPFGPRPAVGDRLLLAHPELCGPRLDRLRLDVEWMGLPESLRARYRNYPRIPGAAALRARLSLVERGVVLPLSDAGLFREGEGDAAPTAVTQTIEVDVAAAVAAAGPGLRYVRRPDLARPDDLAAADRRFEWELGPIDFGHADYPLLAARKARELAIAIARGAIDPGDADDYRVDPPYTPVIRRLRAAYRASLELDPAAAGDGVDRLLHVHPFGACPIDPADPRLFPRYEAAGELYVGLVDAALPQRLSLLVVVAEGTSDADLEPSPIEWSILDGDRWRPLGGEVVHDSTRGLVNSGIVELLLPAVAPSARLPPGRTWLRAAIAERPGSVCDVVEIHAQALALVFDDRGNAADHYAQPLPVGSVERLVDPDPRIAAIVQPFTSHGGRPAESEAEFYTRVSERLRHKRRALSPWDYERLVLQRFAGVYKAKCLAAGAAGGRGDVDVIVVPDIRAQLPADAFAPRAPANLLAEIQGYLAALAPASARVRVRNPHYVAVSVRLGVRFQPGQDLRQARRRLADDLCRYLSPWAYDEGAELTIGGKIYASSILDFVDRRDYVDYVAELRLARSDDGVNFTVLPPTADDYHVAAERPDQVLVAARHHHVDVIDEREYQQSSFTGLDYMKIELDFLIG